MTARIARLRIAGFKSFAEPTVLEILPGLSGIVGPNGCGKSNVVEALRWGMGETSARSLRGGEMEEVIFAGSAGRPARNLAEVTITLEGAAGLAPAPHTELDELEITRRIERGAGSAYRVNGRELRARDVQTLFADLASGARSSAMVSQGRVAALVDARPEDRRSVLEEAAGITGLHARRHEAELKLRATEANLARLADVAAGLAGQLEVLSRQAVDARAYRAAAAGLAEAERVLLGIVVGSARARGETAARTREAAERALEEAKHAAGEASEAERGLERRRAENAGEASLATVLRERARAACEAVEAEVAREAEARERVRARRTEAESDQVRAGRDLAVAESAGESLAAEAAGLEAAVAAHPDRAARAEREREAARLALDGHVRAAQAAAEAAAVFARARATWDEAAQRVDELEAERRSAEAEMPDPASVAAAERTEHEAAARAALLRGEHDVAASAASGAGRAAEARRLAAERAQDGRLRAEERRRSALALVRDREAEGERLASRLGSAQGVSEGELEAAEAALAAAREAVRAAVSGREASERERGRTRDAAAEARLAAEAATVALAAARERESVHEAARRELSGRVGTLALEFRAAAEAMPGQATLSACADELEQAAAGARNAAEAMSAAQDGVGRARDAEGTARAAVAGAEAEAAGIEAVLGSLSRIAAGPEDALGGAAPVLETMLVPEALAAGLAGALGASLLGSISDEAPCRWRELSRADLPLLPGEARGFDGLVEAPPALRGALSQIGWIEDAGRAGVLQGELSPGQVLVDAAGAMWRWDGYVAEAGVPSPLAERMRAMREAETARMRLEELQTSTAALRERAAKCAEACSRLAAALGEAERERRSAERRLDAARTADAAIRAQAAGAAARLEAVAPALAAAREALASEEETAGTAGEQVALAASRDAACRAAAETSAERAARAREAEAAAEAARAGALDGLGAAESDHAALADRSARARALLEAVLPERARVEREAAAAREALDEATAAANEAALQATEEVARAAGGVSAAEEATAVAAAALHGVREADAAVAEATSERLRLEEVAGRSGARLAALEPLRTAAQLRAAEAARVAEEAERAQAMLGAAAGDEGELRAAEAACAAAMVRIATETEAATSRLARIVAEAAAVGVAVEAGRARLGELTVRRSEALSAERALDGARAGREARAAEARRGLAVAEERHREAEGATARDEREALVLREAREAAERRLAERREASSRAEAQAAQAAEAGIAAERARMEFEARTGDGLAVPEGRIAGEAEARRTVARLIAERDAIGPVNLLADGQAEALSTRVAAIGAETTELEEAIGKLRASIGHLNREGRERLRASFVQIDAQFRNLFGRMFEGGRAHLALVGSEDPLEAGLEIYAQPPGKRLATLSLLSGGEQALTALSLIFAAFRCNPAPVSVLDEVDAPLDDANVARFCRLLADMTAETGTRFLVVTHHQLTMAHMDRLYGVTMQERGVSRMLSVDLGRAREYADAG